MSDLPYFLRLPSTNAIEVFRVGHQNCCDKSEIWDGNLIPNQWLLNERGLSATLGERIEELERKVDQAEQMIASGFEYGHKAAATEALRILAPSLTELEDG